MCLVFAFGVFIDKIFLNFFSHLKLMSQNRLETNRVQSGQSCRETGTCFSCCSAPAKRGVKCFKNDEIRSQGTMNTNFRCKQKYMHFKFCEDIVLSTKKGTSVFCSDCHCMRTCFHSFQAARSTCLQFQHSCVPVAMSFHQ